MSEQVEKIIYELSSKCFEINGISLTNKNDYKLFFTNLGNLVVSQDSDIEEVNNTRYVYNYSENRQRLVSSLDEQNICIEGEGVKFYEGSSRGTKTVISDVKIVMSIIDYESICSGQVLSSFTIKDNKTILNLNNLQSYLGGVNCDHEKIVFIGGKNRFDIYYRDIERFIITDTCASLKGYFHMEKEGIVARNITLFNNDIKEEIPQILETIVNDNKKIGNLPQESKIVFCRVSGCISGKDYKNSNCLLVKYMDQLILINKNTKEHIVSTTWDDCSKMSLSKDLIIYDGSDVFSLIINDNNRKIMKLDELKEIDDKKIGYTPDNYPIIIDESDSKVTICKSKKDVVMDISSSDISDVIITSDNGDSDFVNTTIVYLNKYFEVYMREEIANQIIKNIYLSNKRELIQKLDAKVLFENLAKATNDVTVYNFFASTYKLYDNIKVSLENKLKDEARIEISNNFYNEIQNINKELDVISYYYKKFIDSIKVNFYDKYDIEYNKEKFKNVKNVFLRIINRIERNLDQIEDSLDKIIFLVAEKYKNKYNMKMLKESESNTIDAFLIQAFEKLEHCVMSMIPCYIDEIGSCIKELLSFSCNLENLNDNSEFKDFVLDKLTKIFLFKQLTDDVGSSDRKKDIIDKLYVISSQKLLGVDDKKYYIEDAQLLEVDKNWKEKYELVDINTEQKALVDLFKVVISDEIFKDMMEKKEKNKIVNNEENILQNFITDIDIDDEVSIDTAFKELEDDKNAKKDNLNVEDYDIDEDIKELLDKM